jgi:hypothetical protein
MFDLLVIRGARDWVSGHVPQYDDVDAYQIVPKSWGKNNGLTSLVDSILNCTPLTAKTNRGVIKDRLPNVYLPELIAQSGEARVRATLETHLISPAAFDILLRKPFTGTDFDAFLSERQRSFQEAIEDLLVKERLDLPPRLRELDQHIEDVELRLRVLINDALDGDPSRLPSHVQRHVETRLQSTARKNPATTRGYHETLAGKLEYADLRELEGVVVSSLWPAFEGRFGTKEMLQSRFIQLAELRNAIRHNRTVSDVVRKDGEAALLWFRETLLIA